MKTQLPTEGQAIRNNNDVHIRVLYLSKSVGRVLDTISDFSSEIKHTLLASYRTCMHVYIYSYCLLNVRVKNIQQIIYVYI